jgi:hypothetical protein
MSEFARGMYEKLDAAAWVFLNGSEEARYRKEILKIYGEYSAEKQRLRSRIMGVLREIDPELVTEIQNIEELGKHLSQIKRRCLDIDANRYPDTRRDCIVTLTHQPTTSLSEDLLGREIAQDLGRINCPRWIIENLAHTLPSSELSNLAINGARRAIHALRAVPGQYLEARYRDSRPPILVHYFAVLTSNTRDAEDIHWQHFNIETPPRSIEMSSEVAHCECHVEYQANASIHPLTLYVRAFNRDMAMRSLRLARSVPDTVGRTDAQLLFIFAVALGLLHYADLWAKQLVHGQRLPEPRTLVVCLVAADEGSGRLVAYYTRAFGLRPKVGSSVMERSATEILQDFVGDSDSASLRFDSPT